MNDRPKPAGHQDAAGLYKHSVYHLLRERAVADSADYAEQHLSGALIFNTDRKLWDYAASSARLDSGLLLEFGVFEGRSINHFSTIFAPETVHGFDSFEGLAEDWTGYNLAKGAFSLDGRLPTVNENVTLHKGWFQDTLPDFLEANSEGIRFCHMDADTFGSSYYVLQQIAGSLVPGSVMVFDEYFGFPNWRLGEFHAWQKVCAESGLKYKYIAFSDMQVAVEIL